MALPKRRPRTYQPATITLLTRIWTLAGEPCGKYLASIIADELERLERFGELKTHADPLTDEVRHQLLNMSAATMDRHLKPVRDARYPADSLSSTKPGAMLWGRYADATTRWEHITGRPVPAPALMTDASGLRPAPAFVQWLMGLPTGCVTQADQLTQNHQITALGNRVLPLHAVAAPRTLKPSGPLGDL